MKTMETPAYKKLVSLAKRLGGRVIPTDGSWEGDRWETFPKGLGRRGWSTAPFCSNIGIYWTKKIVAHKMVGFTNAGLIHEMAHVFACPYPPNHNSCEETEFLGWELTLAEKLGIRAQWMREMKSYGLHDEDDNFTEIGMLERGERKRIFAKHVELAQVMGSLGPRREIRSIRH
jgi:hypothetical protein